MSEDKLHLLDVCRNAEGSILAYLSPLDDDGEEKSGYRIAGPKAWGGSKSLAKLKISTHDLAVYVNKYAPDVKNKIDSDVPALLDALEMFVNNSSVQTNYPDFCEYAEKLIAKHRGES